MPNPSILQLLLTLGLVLAQFGCVHLGTDKETFGNQIIQEIEEFRSREKKLPDSLNEVGIAEKEEGPVYYRKVDDASYELWYGTTLGESRTYNSNRKKWE